MSIVRYAKTGQVCGFYNEHRVTPDVASDVYMYEHVDGFIACQECKLGGSQNTTPYAYPFVMLKTYDAALNHLLEHREAGHATPQYAIDSLTRCVGVPVGNASAG